MQVQSIKVSSEFGRDDKPKVPITFEIIPSDGQTIEAAVEELIPHMKEVSLVIITAQEGEGAGGTP